MKFEISKEWCEESAKLEQGQEISAGSIPIQEELNIQLTEDVKKANINEFGYVGDIKIAAITDTL